MASRTRPTTMLLLLALGLCGCGHGAAPLPEACLASPSSIARALQRAPAAVTLADGTRLSTCLRRARSDSELQLLGSGLLAVADSLEAHAARDQQAAVRLGYLAGATRRGVAASPGLTTQIGRRVEHATQLPGATTAARTALRGGLRAGEAGG